MIEIDIRSAMLAHTGLTSIVGDRIAAMIMNEGEIRHYITYQMISSINPATLCGNSDQRQVRMQINCFSTNYSQTKQMSIEVQDAVESYAGFDVVLNGEQDLYDSNTKLFYVVIEYSVWQSV